MTHMYRKDEHGKTHSNYWNTVISTSCWALPWGKGSSRLGLSLLSGPHMRWHWVVPASDAAFITISCQWMVLIKLR